MNVLMEAMVGVRWETAHGVWCIVADSVNFVWNVYSVGYPSLNGSYGFSIYKFTIALDNFWMFCEQPWIHVALFLY